MKEMTSTKERIEADIKANLKPYVPTLIVTMLPALKNEINDHAVLGLSRMKDMVTPGTKAFEQEATLATKMIEPLIAKEIIEYLKTTYKIK